MVRTRSDNLETRWKKVENIMARPSSKSIETRLKEAEEKALRLKAQAAKESGNPIIAELSQMLENVGKEINILSRSLKGPNSFDYRIRAAELKDAFVRAERDYVECKDAILRRRREFLHNAIATTGAMLANGQTPILPSILADLPADPMVDTLAKEFERARNEWRDFVGSKGATESDTDTIPQGLKDVMGSDA